MGVDNFRKRVLSPLHFIYRVGESDILKKPAKFVPVKSIRSSKFRKKLKYLKDCLLEYRKVTGLGRGIAAVQVGILEKFAVIYTPKKLITIVNPKITKVSESLNKYPESCMSATPVIVPLVRPAWIEFDYYDEKGNLRYWDTKDDNKLGKMLNRVFQHEIDHMEGIVNLGRGNPKEFIIYSSPNELKKAKFEEVK